MEILKKATLCQKIETGPGGEGARRCSRCGSQVDYPRQSRSV